jgi:uncharacterized membrane protein
MTKAEFLDALRRRLAGLPQAEIDELLGDYATHFHEGLAAGRSEAEIAQALGDPMRVARELRAEAAFRRWEKARTPANFFAVLFGFVALIAVDVVFIVLLLLLLFILAMTAFMAGITVLVLCLTGIGVMLKWDSQFSSNPLAHILSGVGLLGLGIGGGALLLLTIDWVVRLLWIWARLHYRLLNKAEA